MKKIKYKITKGILDLTNYPFIEEKVDNEKDPTTPDYSFYIQDYNVIFYLRIFTTFIKLHNRRKNKIIIPIKYLIHKWYKNDSIDKIKI